MSDTIGAHVVSNDVYLDIQRFLYLEAGLLDGREYKQWFDLLTDDVEYSVRAQVATDAGSERVDYALIDEGATELKSRIDQISNSRLTRAESPPSFTRRFISNIEACCTDEPEEFAVSSYMLTYRSRSIVPEGGFYVGVRFDRLRKQGSQLRLARRVVRLDQSKIFDGALSTIL